MPESLPLFPLGTVLFPGLVLPLHVFEERYRRLMDDLLELPADEDRRFGVVAIELGHEVGESSTRRMAAVGCTAEIQGVNRYEDGRFDVVAVGGRRFRVERVADPAPYLTADVTHLPDVAGDGVGPLAESVLRLFRGYAARLETLGGEIQMPDELPDDPIRLSYAVAAAMIADQPDKQRLLEAETAAERLTGTRELLRRELRVLSRLRTLPAGQFIDKGVSAN
ncbi:MAG: peptidase S16 [Streptosporangiales bacterium]|nr:peptidase S16 [Streptosporangiales bacterium]